jgi:Protein of unknown function (DUF2782)
MRALLEWSRRKPAMNRLASPLAVAVFAALVTALPARAADVPAAPVTQPLPEAPPPPNVDDADLGPEITITQRESQTVEEARVNGILVWIRVTPRNGRPYYLIPTGGGNTFIRRDSLGTDLKVPMWVLLTW